MEVAGEGSKVWGPLYFERRYRALGIDIVSLAALVGAIWNLDEFAIGEENRRTFGPGEMTAEGLLWRSQCQQRLGLGADRSQSRTLHHPEVRQQSRLECQKGTIRRRRNPALAAHLNLG